jgi:hypothetical protein
LQSARRETGSLESSVFSEVALFDKLIGRKRNAGGGVLAGLKAHRKVASRLQETSGDTAFLSAITKMNCRSVTDRWSI